MRHSHSLSYSFHFLLCDLLGLQNFVGKVLPEVHQEQRGAGNQFNGVYKIWSGPAYDRGGLHVLQPLCNSVGHSQGDARSFLSEPAGQQQLHQEQIPVLFNINLFGILSCSGSILHFAWIGTD